MELPEVEETNDLMCIILRKDGDIDRVPHGKIEKGDSLPQNGDGYFVGDIGCTVAGRALGRELVTVSVPIMDYVRLATRDLWTKI